MLNFNGNETFSKYNFIRWIALIRHNQLMKIFETNLKVSFKYLSIYPVSSLVITANNRYRTRAKSLKYRLDPLLWFFCGLSEFFYTKPFWICISIVDRLKRSRVEAVQFSWTPKIWSGRYLWERANTKVEVNSAYPGWQSLCLIVLTL